MIRICTLASGSSGNAVYAECEDGAVVIDAGISGRRMAQGIAAVGGDIDRVQGVLVTHDHTDHVRSAGVLFRRHRLPLWMTAGTQEHARRALGRVDAVQHFAAGDTLTIGSFAIHTLATPHDSREPVAVILEHDSVRCGVLTDLGHPFAALCELLPTLDAVVLESNHDPEMLARGPYPEMLKRRIRSDHGHISNEEAAELVASCTGPRLQTVLLAHLSEVNNHPALALDCMTRRLEKSRSGETLQILAAPRHQPSPLVSVSRR